MKSVVTKHLSEKDLIIKPYLTLIRQDHYFYTVIDDSFLPYPDVVTLKVLEKGFWSCSLSNTCYFYPFFELIFNIEYNPEYLQFFTSSILINC